MKKIKSVKDVLKAMQSYPAFFRKVWKATMQIPPGETRSYKWVAENIGHPRAARAVAMALKKNPFAPIVPCHRVIRSDGKIGGYSGFGGIKKKIYLLEKEKEQKT